MKKEAQPHQVFKLELPTPFLVGDVNVYLIKGEQLTLVDVGPNTKEAWEAFQSQLKEIGYTPQDIDQIVITHHHPDHIGMLDYFRKDVPVLGHSFNEPWLKKSQQFLVERMAFFERLFVKFGVEEKFFPSLKRASNPLGVSRARELTVFLREGKEIDGLSGWRVVETPGHAQSHIVLYEEVSGTLIGGDLLLKHISPNPFLEIPWNGEAKRPRPQLQLNHSISKLLDMPISLVYPGHGENIEEAHKLIAYRLKRQAEKAERVRSLIAEKPLTAFQACQALYPTKYDKMFMLTMSETVGQLDYLVEMGQIIVDTTQKTHIYTVN